MNFGLNFVEADRFIHIHEMPGDRPNAEPLQELLWAHGALVGVPGGLEARRFKEVGNHMAVGPATLVNTPG